MSDFVSYEQTGDVAVLTMDDGKANAFSLGMTNALMSGLDRAEREAGAVVITGRPGVLCAGFDLKVIRGDDAEAKEAMRMAGVETLLRLYLHPQPVVIANTGHALAAGALLLLTGDCRIGARGDFKIGLNEVAIGLPLPPFGLELARDRLTSKAMTEAILCAKMYDPEGAVAAGYMDQAQEPDAVLDAAMVAAEGMLTLDKTAFGTTKTYLRGETVAKILASLKT